MAASTYSLVAFDRESSEWGVAVQSRFPAIGALAPWAEAAAGAIATQSWIEVSYGREAGDAVELVGPDGVVFAKGISSAAASDLAGRPRGLEAVHRDRLVVY